MIDSDFELLVLSDDYLANNAAESGADALIRDLTVALRAAAAKADKVESLRKALADTLNMLRAAHMQCGVHHDGNKRVVAARAALSAFSSHHRAPTENTGE